MQLSHALDTDDIRTGALDVGPHTIQEVGHINHVGFLRHVLNRGLSLRQRRRHHNIDSRAHGNLIQINMAAHQIYGMGQYRAPLNVHLGP